MTSKTFDCEQSQGYMLSQYRGGIKGLLGGNIGPPGLRPGRLPLNLGSGP